MQIRLKIWALIRALRPVPPAGRVCIRLSFAFPVPGMMGSHERPSVNMDSRGVLKTSSLSQRCRWWNSPYLFFFFFSGCPAGHVVSYFPDQGSNPHPLQWKHRFLTIGPPREGPGLAIAYKTGGFQLFLAIRVCFGAWLSSTEIHKIPTY